MSTPDNTRIRYSPSGWGEQDLIYNFSRTEDLGLAVTTVLASAFTPLAEDLYTRYVLDSDQIILPGVLSGDEPATRKVRDYVREFNGSFMSPGGMDFGIDDFYRPTMDPSEDAPIAEWTYKKSADIVYSFGHHHVGETGDVDIQISIGQFGSKTAYALVDTVRALYSLIGEEYKDYKTPDEFKNVIQTYTFMEDMPNTLKDSFNSMAQAFAFLTNWSEVPGYEDDPVGLFRTLIENGSFVKLGRYLLLGDLAIVSSFSLSPVDVLNKENLTIKKDFLAPLIKRQRYYRKVGLVTGQGIGFGCPVSMGHTSTTDEDGSERLIDEPGINIAAKIFLRYFEHYFNQ